MLLFFGAEIDGAEIDGAEIDIAEIDLIAGRQNVGQFGNLSVS